MLDHPPVEEAWFEAPWTQPTHTWQGQHQVHPGQGCHGKKSKPLIQRGPKKGSDAAQMPRLCVPQERIRSCMAVNDTSSTLIKSTTVPFQR